MSGKEKTDEMSTFIDVFHRADKNDDGKISWEEFKLFFADGVLSEAELQTLFKDMDTHNTNNIDTGELCGYFSKHLGSFKEVFNAVEVLNSTVSKALHRSAEEYEKSDMLEQFVHRFLLRELVHQLSASQHVMDGASDCVDEQAQAKRSGIPQMSAEAVYGGKKRVVDAESDTVDPSTILPGRYARRARQQLSTQTSWTVEAGLGTGVGFGISPNLNQQVDRLRQLIDRLENKVNFDGATDEQVDITDEELIMVVRRKLAVNEKHDKAFRASLRTYIEATNTAGGCLHLGIRSYAGTSSFVIYEIWEDNESWISHVASKTHKTFQHSNIDYLDTPEQLSTMPIPSNWWKKD